MDNARSPQQPTDRALGLLLTSMCRAIAVWDTLSASEIPQNSAALLAMVEAGMDDVAAKTQPGLTPVDGRALGELHLYVRETVNQMRAALQLSVL